MLKFQRKTIFNIYSVLYYFYFNAFFLDAFVMSEETEKHGIVERSGG